ncbi:TRAP transporter small permease [Roseospira visakhapatnamensis]|uniref:TRAP transporter small permease protein n=1 Tax=Roseospira visakhapatnamensis TaxID=390880 RepID=A0A7W6REI2_9PROT|nr:TRAP transporter small permease [Roseospira visakhapatnamensis]MBB4266564.1 C4-dicarboxylate transporter DctQ subunit [Roseospira visakhapatnamensis]
MHHGTSAELRRSLVDRIEVAGIALILGLMTLVTFANVVARYVFNTNILWALETTVFLFAWLVLLGASHCVKISAHIGVDLILNLVPRGLRKALVLLSVAVCLAFSGMLLVGAWHYWWPFATSRAWYEVNDIPMVFLPDLMATWFNEGEEYEKLPRFIPYAALPIGLFLLTLRFLQAGWDIAMDHRVMLIASHDAEGEEMLAEMRREADAGTLNQAVHASRQDGER